MMATPDKPPALLVVGGLHVDEVAKLQANLVERASNPVCWQRYVGGVAGNAARAALAQYMAAGCGCVSLHAALGNDEAGLTLIAAMQTQGIRMVAQVCNDSPTGRYSAIITSSGELLMGFADVQLAEKLRSIDVIRAMQSGGISSLLLDANLSSECIHDVIEAADRASVSVAALAVSPAKAVRLLPLATNINLLFCNRREALALAVASGLIDEDVGADQPELSQLAQALSDMGFMEFVLTDGDAELLIGCQGAYNRHTTPQVPVTHNVNGAGDALAGASYAAITLGATLDEAVTRYGVQMASDVVTGKRLPLAL